MRNKATLTLASIYFAYFIMGLVDIVGISANYVKEDFRLNESMTSFLPMMAFISFAFLAIPSGPLMNRIGRKNSVLLSFIITLAAMLVPLTGYTFTHMLIAFALAGIGNTLMQTSVNPLLGDVVDPRHLTSSLTLGQFFRSASSALGPSLLALVLLISDNWKNIFILYCTITLAATLWLWKMPIQEKRAPGQTGNKSLLPLLTDKYILLLFTSLFLFVGIDVAMNVYTPRFLITHSHFSLKEAGLGPTLYFTARIIGSLLGAWILVRYPARKLLQIILITGTLTFLSMMLMPHNTPWVLTSIFITGLMCANIFSILLSLALQHKPRQANEISGLMIMAVSGGAIIPLLIGYINDLTQSTQGMYTIFACFLLLTIASFLLAPIPKSTPR